MSFQKTGLSKALLKEVEKQGFQKPFPIQEQCIPAVLKKKDILGIAKTGSGKTAGYVLPVLENIRQLPDPKNRFVQALILVPTRELAMQVEEVLKTFGRAFSDAPKCMAVYGGVSVNPQMMKLSGVRILVATPGRLLDLIESNALHLSALEMLILDEADKMLALGFREEMDKIFQLLPKKRQNLLFSATLSDQIDKINRILLHDPVVLKVEEKEESIDLINQLGYFISDEKKGPLLRYIIKSKKIKQVLIFVASGKKADNLAVKLNKNGIHAVAIHGKKSQQARNNALQRFKLGQIRALVATDLLARGVDIENLPCVINYELPRSPKDFVHRIGRTGRAESTGEAITIITEEDKHHFRVIQKKMGKWVTMVDTSDIDLQGF